MTVEAQTEAGSLGGDFVDAAEHALASGKLDAVSDAELEQVMTAAVRLYAAKAAGRDCSAASGSKEGGPPSNPTHLRERRRWQ